MHVEIGGKPGEDSLIRRNILVDGKSLGDRIGTVSKYEMADVVVKRIQLQTDILPPEAIGEIELVALFGLEVDIAELDGIGTDVFAVAGELVDGRGPKALGDIEFDILVVR